MKILHFAPENYARVPANLVRAERKQGHESFLITLYPTFQDFKDEDVCLDLPFVATDYLKFLKKLFSSPAMQVSNRRRDAARGVPVWRPSNAVVAKLFALRDKIWEKKIWRTLERLDIWSFDLLFLDGGVGFLRNAEIVRQLKAAGVKIVTCYCGSDLRTRGIIPAVEELAEHRFTFEFDHTLLYPSLQFMFFPFELVDYEQPPSRSSSRIRIGHAPTNRLAKGTDAILSQLRSLETKHPIEIVLIENLPHKQALTLKASCDIFVDTVGELGYGVNSLEAMTMGIPTAVEILPDFEKVLGEHPFINISSESVAEALVPFIESKEMRKEYGERGRHWVAQHHEPVRVSQKILSAIENRTGL